MANLDILGKENLIEGYAVNEQFLEIKMGEITAGSYLLSFVEIVHSVWQIGTGDLLIVNNYIFE